MPVELLYKRMREIDLATSQEMDRLKQRHAQQVADLKARIKKLGFEVPAQIV